MKVMVTGGTGFVGCHTVAEILKAGHDVKLLARSPNNVRPALDPFGIGEIETVIGDVTDVDSVQRAVEGCDAVIHCASVYSFDPRAAGRINRTNVGGTRLVIETAHRAGLDPIVHVSSVVALMGNKGQALTPNSSPMKPKATYPRSKADSEVVARSYQEEGAPVVITYPGMVWGPNDPHLGETCQIVHSILRRFWTMLPAGGVPTSDVRDVAKVHAMLLEKGRGPQRYIIPSESPSIKDLVRKVASLTGRWLPCVALPGWMLRGPMRAADAMQHISPFRFPVNYQSVYIAALDHTVDDSVARTKFGIDPTPIRVSMADTIRWMYKGKHLSRRLVGSLAD